MVTNEEDVPRFSLRRGARFQETFRAEPESEAPDHEWLADLGQDLDGEQTEDLGNGEVEVAGDQLEPEIALHRRFGSGETVEEPHVPITPRAQPAAPRASVGDSGRFSYKRKLEELAALAFDPSSRRDNPPPPKDVPQPAQPAEVVQPVPVDQPVPAVDQPALDEAVSALAEHLAELEQVLARTAAACSVARMTLQPGQALLDHPSASAGTSSPGDLTPVIDLRQTAPEPPEPDPTPAHPAPARRQSPESPALSRLITPLRRYGSATLRDLLRPE